MASCQGMCSVTQRCPARWVKIAATASSRRKSCWTRRGRCSSGFFRSTGTSSNCRGLRSAPGGPEVRGNKMQPTNPNAHTYVNGTNGGLSSAKYDV